MRGRFIALLAFSTGLTTCGNEEDDKSKVSGSCFGGESEGIFPCVDFSEVTQAVIDQAKTQCSEDAGTWADSACEVSEDWAGCRMSADGGGSGTVWSPKGFLSAESCTEGTLVNKDGSPYDPEADLDWDVTIKDQALTGKIVGQDFTPVKVWFEDDSFKEGMFSITILGYEPNATVSLPCWSMPADDYTGKELKVIGTVKAEVGEYTRVKLFDEDADLGITFVDEDEEGSPVNILGAKSKMIITAITDNTVTGKMIAVESEGTTLEGTFTGERCDKTAAE